MKQIYLALLAILLTSCADTHQLMRMGGEATKLDPQGVVYVSVSADGRYGQTTYYGSGQNTTQIVTMAFSRYADRVESGHSTQDYDSSLVSARKIGAKYLVIPTILEWEDRATEWSAIPDKASIKIAIYDVISESSVDSVIIKGKSGLATFGGDHPQDLLPKPTEEYVTSLY